MKWKMSGIFVQLISLQCILIREILLSVDMLAGQVCRFDFLIASRGSFISLKDDRYLW